MRGVAAGLLLFVASWSPAFAKIKFCNDFKHALHIAVVYETSNGWVFEGWTGVKPNSCYEDNDYSELTSFFYHAETDAIDTGGGNKNNWTWATIAPSAWRTSRSSSQMPNTRQRTPASPNSPAP
jgi:uncharacterized membrane protein